MCHHRLTAAWIIVVVALGSDYVLSFFAGDTASVTLTKTSSGGSAASGRMRTIYAGDSIIVQIPLNKLGNDDGNMTISAIVGTKDRPTDIVPNTGVVTARVPSAAIVAGALSAGVTRDPVSRVPARAPHHRATTGWPRPVPDR